MPVVGDDELVCCKGCLQAVRCLWTGSGAGDNPPPSLCICFKKPVPFPEVLLILYTSVFYKFQAPIPRGELGLGEPRSEDPG